MDSDSSLDSAPPASPEVDSTPGSPPPQDRGGSSASNSSSTSSNARAPRSPSVHNGSSQEAPESSREAAGSSRSDSPNPDSPEPDENPESPSENPESPTEIPQSPTENPDSPAENPDSPVENPDSPVDNPDSPVDSPADSPIQDDNPESPPIEERASSPSQISSASSDVGEETIDSPAEDAPEERRPVKETFKPHAKEDLSDVSDLEESQDGLGFEELVSKPAPEPIPKHPHDALETELDFEAEEKEEEREVEVKKEEGEREAPAVKIEVKEEKEEGEEDDGERSDGEVKDGEDLEEGECTDGDDPRPEETEPRPICRFYNRGQCTWGSNCRFVHPGVTDKGNYCMFDMVRPLVPANGPPGYPEARFDKVPPPYMGAGPPPVVEPQFESPWERGLRQAKECFCFLCWQQTINMSEEKFGIPFEEYEEMLAGKVDDLDKIAEKSSLTYRQTLRLIHAKSSAAAASRKGKGKPFSYKELAASMNLQPAFAEKLKKRWENLRDKYKKIVDPATGTGNPQGTAKINWVFFEPMWACLKEDSAVHPEGLLDSGNPGGPQVSFAPPKLTTVVYGGCSSSSSSTEEWKKQVAAEIAAEFISTTQKKGESCDSTLSWTDDSAFTGEDDSSPSTSKKVNQAKKVANKVAKVSDSKKKHRQKLPYDRNDSDNGDCSVDLLSAFKESQTNIQAMSAAFLQSVENNKNLTAVLTSLVHSIQGTPKQAQTGAQEEQKNGEKQDEAN